MSRKDLVTGCVLSVISLVYLFEAIQLPVGGATFSDVGPRPYPLLVGVCLLCVSSLLIIKSFAGKIQMESEAEDDVEPPATEKTRTVALMFMIGVTAIYLLVLESVGFVIATAVYLGVVAIIVAGTERYRGVRLLLPLVFGCVSATVFYVVFAGLLDVLLPEGLFSLGLG